MNLTTPHLQLRELTWSDLADIHRLHTYPEVARFNTLDIPRNQQTTREVMRPTIRNAAQADQTGYGWTIRIADQNLFIGEAGLNLSPPRHRRGEIFYKLLPEYWGHGYATEAAQALVRFGFGVLKLHRIEAGAATENHASVRVLEKIGMMREGIGRKILPTPGGWRDNYRYAILEDDPPAS
jgi:RimJ/RimL family protein N-acetyltransferase